jgi:hypothetical protein
MFTSLPPVEGVRLIPLMVTANERMEVLGGGTKGNAASVTFREAEPPPPQLTVQPLLTPLQDVRISALETARNAKTLLEFMQTPHE